MTDLDENLQPIDAPVTEDVVIPAYDTDSELERGVINDVHIKNLSADKISAGTITATLSLGTASGSVVLDGANSRLVAGDGTTNRVSLDGTASFKFSDPGDDVLTTAGTALAFYFNPTSGNLTMKGDVINTNAEVFNHVTSEHWFTAVATFEKLTGSSFILNGDNFINQKIYYECNMLVEQGGRAAITRLWNLTDGIAVPFTEIQSAEVGTYDAGRGIYTNWDVVRSGTYAFPSGEKEYCVEVKQNATGGDGDKAHFFQGRVVVIQQ